MTLDIGSQVTKLMCVDLYVCRYKPMGKLRVSKPEIQLMHAIKLLISQLGKHLLKEPSNESLDNMNNS